jgi:hypothetical protein
MVRRKNAENNKNARTIVEFFENDFLTSASLSGRTGEATPPFQRARMAPPSVAPVRPDLEGSTIDRRTDHPKVRKYWTRDSCRDSFQQVRAGSLLETSQTRSTVR